jgi:hypothetical protein
MSSVKVPDADFAMTHDKDWWALMKDVKKFI